MATRRCVNVGLIVLQVVVAVCTLGLGAAAGQELGGAGTVQGTVKDPDRRCDAVGRNRRSAIRLGVKRGRPPQTRWGGMCSVTFRRTAITSPSRPRVSDARARCRSKNGVPIDP